MKSILEKLPFDLQNLLSEYLTNKDKINLEITTKVGGKFEELTYIYTFVDSYKNILTQQILEENKFKKLIELNVRYNPAVINVNHLKNTLKTLNISSYCGVDQKGFEECKN